MKENRSLNKSLLFIPLIMLMIIPTIHADAPAYTIKILINEKDWPNNGKYVAGITGTINGIPLSDGYECNPDSKYSTTCDIFRVLQNERIIQQNDEIISLLKDIKSQGR